MSPSAISLRDVYFSYHGSPDHNVPVLHGVSLDVARGELVVILGPSGSGKSSLLSLIPGLQKPDRGSVEVSKQSGQGGPPEPSIGMVFQDPVLLAWRTTYDNVSLPLEISHGDRALEHRKGPIHDRVEAALAKVRLSGNESSYPHELSGGMQARVAIARALVTNPDVIIMDEPFASLDDITRSALNFALLDIKRETHAAIIFVTHSITEAVLLADRVIMLSRRPAQVVLDLSINFGAARRDEELTESPQFIDYVRQLRLALKKAAA